VRKPVDAKIKHKPLPEEKPEAPRGKVINLMDAFKRSIAEQGKTSAKTRGKKAA